MESPKKRATTRTKAQLSDQLETVATKVATESVDPIASAIVADRNRNVLERTKGLNAATLVAQLGSVGLSIAASLDAVKNELLNAVGQLGTVEAAVKVHEEELAELYGKEVVAASIRALLQEHAQKNEEQIEAFNQRQGAFDEKLKNAQQLELERLEKLQKDRVREEDNYAFAKAQQRRAAEDEWQQQMLAAKRTYAEDVEAANKIVNAREEALMKKETEYSNALIRIENLPAEIESEKKKAVAMAVGAVTSEFKHTAALADMEAKNAKEMLSTINRNLLDQIAQQKATIDALQIKLSAAEGRVESIAKEALQSASGRQALEASTNMASTLKDNSPRKS